MISGRASPDDVTELVTWLPQPRPPTTFQTCADRDNRAYIQRRVCEAVQYGR